MAAMGTGPAAAAAPSARTGWYVVALLALLYAFSFLDRLILSLLAPQISPDLHLSDTDLGILLGAGFAGVYALSGIPAAQWIDRRERRKIVTCAVLLWSSMTIASAFAESYGFLLVCRGGVALGEAVLTPAAVSLIADLFARDKRSLPISVYASVSGLMGTGAFIVGAAVLSVASAIEATTGLAPWRLTLILVGAPGILLALIFFFTTREPARSGEADGGQGSIGENMSLRDFGRYLWQYRRFYLPLYLGVTFMILLAAAQSAWMPTLLVRGYGFTTSQAGYAFGSVCLPSALLAAFFWPALAARLDRHEAGRRDGVLIALLASAILISIMVPLASFFQNPVYLLVAAGFTVFACTGGMLPPLVVQTFGPGRLRGRLIAMSVLAANLFGFSLGPFAVATISQAWPDDPRALVHGLAITSAIAGPLSVLSFAMMFRARHGMPEIPR